MSLSDFSEALQLHVDKDQYAERDGGHHYATQSIHGKENVAASTWLTATRDKSLTPFEDERYPVFDPSDVLVGYSALF